MPGTIGTPLADDVRLRADLVAHHVERALAGSDEHDARRRRRRGEIRVLGEEPVARVDRLRAGLAGGGEDRVDVEIGLRCGGRADAVRRVGLAHVRGLGVGVAVHGDRADAEAPQRADDAAGDLAAVRDEDGVEPRQARGS